MPERVLLFEKGVLLHCFDNSSGTGEVAKAQNYSERNLGSLVDLQLDDYGDWEKCKGKIRNAVDRTVEQANRRESVVAPAPRPGFFSQREVPGCFDGHALADQCASAGDHKADEEHCRLSA